MNSHEAADGVVQYIGLHRYMTDGDIFAAMPCGEMTLDEAKLLIKVLLAAHQRHGYVLYLIDARQAKPMGPELRRYLLGVLRQMPGTFAVASFNTTLILRTFGLLILNAARLMTGFTFPCKFATSEPEARAFLAELRAQFRRNSSALST